MDMASEREIQNIVRDIGGQCLARRARLLSRKLSRIYDEALRPVGLTSGQLGILVAVAANPGARAAELHQRLELEQSSFSRNAALMERTGWIEKQPHGSDRGQELRLTRMGTDLLAEAMPCWRSAQRQAKRLLGADAQNFKELVDQQLLR